MRKYNIRSTLPATFHTTYYGDLTRLVQVAFHDINKWKCTLEMDVMEVFFSCGKYSQATQNRKTK